MVRVPLRASFCGGGTDVKDFFIQHGGACLVSNIAKYVYVSLETRSDEQILIHDIDFEASTIFHYDAVPNFDGYLDLVKACVKFLGLKKGVSILIKSDVAPGSGLGTSSAITAGLLHGLIELFKLKLPHRPKQLGHMAYQVEREILKQHGGMQDQYAATCPGINLLEFGVDNVTVLPLTKKTPADFFHHVQMSTILCYTGETHISSDIMKAHRSVNHLDLMKIKELCYAAFKAWRHQDLKKFAEYVNESYLIKRALHDKVTTPKIDVLYDTAIKQGAWGGKLLGAGGGGYFVFFVPFEAQQRVKKILHSLGAGVEPFMFDTAGIQTWSV